MAGHRLVRLLQERFFLVLGAAIVSPPLVTAFFGAADASGGSTCLSGRPRDGDAV